MRALEGEGAKALRRFVVSSESFAAGDHRCRANVMCRHNSQNKRHVLAGVGAQFAGIKAKENAAVDLHTALTPENRAPVTGTYEVLNPAGVTPSPVHVPVFEGAVFPPLPPGWLWRLAGIRLPADY